MMTKNDLHYINDLKPISKATLETCRKRSAKYIHILSKVDGTCKCEKCECTSTLKNTKHLQKATCPVCNTTLIVNHRCRKTYQYNIEWFVDADIDNGKLVLRYILSYRVNGTQTTLEECAREVFDFDKLKTSCFENRYQDNGTRIWKKGTMSYFREYGMSYSRNRWCCLGATPLSNAWNTVLKLEQFKYFDPRKYMRKDRGYYLSGTVAFMGKHSALFEKLEKVGMLKLVDDALNSYGFREDELKYNKNETELTKMLGITKAGLNYWKSSPDWNTLRLLQKYGNALDAVIEMSKLHVTEWAYDSILKQDNSRKLINYLLSQDIQYQDYTDYLSDLNELGYKIDDSYRYPKYFYEWHNEIASRVFEQRQESERKLNKEKDAKIKAISDGLRKYADIRELLGGSKGFLVYVPESVEDLKREGMMLHNCIGTYANRVADNKTLLFFIRKLDAKDTPWVAMEYRNGRVIQCRYNRNEDCYYSDKKESAEVIQFAELLAKTLRNHNILVA